MGSSPLKISLDLITRYRKFEIDICRFSGYHQSPLCMFSEVAWNESSHCAAGGTLESIESRKYDERWTPLGSQCRPTHSQGVHVANEVDLYQLTRSPAYIPRQAQTRDTSQTGGRGGDWAGRLKCCQGPILLMYPRTRGVLRQGR